MRLRRVSCVLAGSVPDWIFFRIYENSRLRSHLTTYSHALQRISTLAIVRLLTLMRSYRPLCAYASLNSCSRLIVCFISSVTSPFQYLHTNLIFPFRSQKHAASMTTLCRSDEVWYQRSVSRAWPNARGEAGRTKCPLTSLSCPSGETEWNKNSHV